MTEYLPIELEAESITIQEAGRGWEITIEYEQGQLVTYEDMPDMLFEALLDDGVLEYDDKGGRVVRA